MFKKIRLDKDMQSSISKEDTRQGDVVCVECGLVIDKTYCYKLTESNLETKWKK